MAPKAKKEAPAPPKAGAKATASKAKKVRKGDHSHKEKTRTSPPSMAKDTEALKAAGISSEECPQEKQACPLCPHPIPPTTASATEKLEDSNTLCSLDVKANRHQIGQAVKKLYDIDAAKVSTLISPDGEKKACVRLAPDDAASDVANTIGSSNLSPAA